MNKSKLLMLYVFLIPFFIVYAQENSEDLSIKQVIDFTLQEGETVYSVLASSDGTEAVIATSKVSALLKTTNYFVYLGNSKLGPFEHYIQLGNKWEAYNGGGNYAKSNHVIGTAKNYYQSTTTAEISKFKVFDKERHILIDYDSDSTLNEYYTAAGIISIRDGSFNIDPHGILSYIRADVSGNSTTQSLIVGDKRYGPYAFVLGPYSSPDNGKTAYWAGNNQGIYTAYIGEKTYSPFKNRKGAIIWSPNNTDAAFWAVKNEPGRYNDDVTIYAGNQSWGPYRYADGITWSPDGRQIAYWGRDLTDAYYLYINGEKKAGPFQNPPEFIDFVFGNNTLAYVADGMLYIGDEFLRIDNYRNDSLTMKYAHRRSHFAYYNRNSHEFVSSDFHDAFDELPVMKYINVTDEFFSIGLKENGYGNEYRGTFSIIYNDTRKNIEFNKTFYKALVSSDGSKYAVIFSDRSSEERYVHTSEGGDYRYTNSLACYYLLSDMSTPKLMYTRTNISEGRNGQQIPEVLPFGLTAHNTFVYVIQRNEDFYLVKNGEELGPYTSITDNNAGTLDEINWTALSGNKVFSIVSK